MREEVVEVTIEDPAPAFRAMRDRSDFAWVLSQEPLKDIVEYKYLQQISEWYDSCISVEPMERSHIPFPNENLDVASIASLLKLTCAQVTFVFEALEYAVICRSSTNSSCVDENDIESTSKISDLLRTFRLKVKRRLLKANREIKEFQSDKSARQKLLDELYQEQLIRYKNINLQQIAKIRKQASERRMFTES